MAAEEWYRGMHWRIVHVSNCLIYMMDENEAGLYRVHDVADTTIQERLDYAPAIDAFRP